MPKVIQDVRQFRALKPWGALDIAEIEGATVRLHWTDQPYKWHVNDGAEVFLVLDGVVEMRYRDGVEEHRVFLNEGDIFVAETGNAHVAHPQGEARILVVETKGSV